MELPTSLNNPAKAAFFQHIGYEPHAGQILLHNSVDDHTNVTSVCGRRFGKTTAAVYEAAFQALQLAQDGRPQFIYIVSDTFNHAKKIFDPLSTLFQTKLVDLLPKSRTGTVKGVYRKDMKIVLDDGSEIHAKSADNIASLAGDGVTFCIVDESGFVSDEAIMVLEPALMDRKAKRLNIGTPDRSDTWFKTDFDMGFSDDEDYHSIQLPSHTNPINDETYMDKQRDKYGDEYYRRMFLAEFLNTEANPLMKILDGKTFIPAQTEPIPNRKYIIGADVADRTDWFAVAVVDVTEADNFKAVYADRWKGIGYEASAHKLGELARTWNRGRVYFDRTGVGDAFAPLLYREYSNSVPIVFSMSSKQTMFDTLAAYLEKDRLTLVDNAKMLAELRSVRATQKTKGVSYAAPPGMNDDFFAALLLSTNGYEHIATEVKAFSGGYARPL